MNFLAASDCLEHERILNPKVNAQIIKLNSLTTRYRTKTQSALYIAPEAIRLFSMICHKGRIFAERERKRTDISRLK